ncbi:PadR family transcriptional regulator [Paenibacillus sp. 3LSP]|uniref:PadR family transcriptional regulator n=1 Tax=Paenibacillus TaxID=44249 RepID=UPI000AD3FB5F|nr:MULTISPECIES: PadR family transcriptional regulator [Paenibacillus]MDU0331338.1 PadR family transcriptional regulator [Paenibacillus sp. 3LSP]MEC2343834.1 PadR family transcriptional regulator [Paenibacillus barengoltzii]
MTNLIILALLRDRPMHGYEIQQLIQTSRMDTWANLLSGSIYYALNKMEQEGLIQTVAEERTGARLRKIYGITEAGEVAFQNMIRESLTLTPHSVKSDFTLALSWVDAVPREEALALLRQNLQRLEDTLALWRQGRELKKEYLNAFTEASFDNGMALLQLDIDYLQRIIGLLEEKQEES